MGNQKLEAKTNEPEEDSYKVIAYKGNALPEEYLNLIRAPFLTSLRYGNDLFKLIDQDAYYKTYNKYLESILKRNQTVVRLAALDDKTILGWSLSEPNLLHYVWVKKEVRRQGIMQSLLPEFTTFSHITNKWIPIWNKYHFDARFNPFV